MGDFKSFLKDAFFFKRWNELFGPKRLESAVIVVWPWELVRSTGNCLENIFIFDLGVIRRLEKFLQQFEVKKCNFLILGRIMQDFFQNDEKYPKITTFFVFFFDFQKI